MDRTLKRVTYRQPAAQPQRNWKAWQLFSPDGETCRFCPHGAADHLTSSGQPHFYRPATEAERRDLLVTPLLLHPAGRWLHAGQEDDRRQPAPS